MNLPQQHTAGAVVDDLQLLQQERPATAEFFQVFADELENLERTVPLSQQLCDIQNCFTPRPLAPENTAFPEIEKALKSVSKTVLDDEHLTKPTLTTQPQHETIAFQSQQLFGQQQSSLSPGPLTMNADALLRPDELSEFFASSADGATARHSNLGPLLSALDQQQQQGGGILKTTDGGGANASSRRTSLDFLAALSETQQFRRSSLGAPLPQDVAPSVTATSGGMGGAADVVANGKRKFDGNGREFYMMPLNDVAVEASSADPSVRRAKRRRSSMKHSILRRMSNFSAVAGSVGTLDQFDWVASSVPAHHSEQEELAAFVAQRRRSSMGMGMGTNVGNTAMLRRLSTGSTVWFDDAAMALRPDPGDAAAGVGTERRGSMGSLGPLSICAMGAPGALERGSSIGSTASWGPLDGDATAERRNSLASLAALEQELFRRSSLDHLNSTGAIGPATTAKVALPPFSVPTQETSNVVTPSLDQLERVATQQWQERVQVTSSVAPTLCSGLRRVSVASSGSHCSSAASAMSAAALLAAASVSNVKVPPPLLGLHSAGATALLANQHQNLIKMPRRQQQQLQAQQQPRIDPNRAMTTLVVAMERSKKSQSMLHAWDKKMGLKKSHSKTMRMTRLSREGLIDEVGMQLIMAGGGIAAEMARATTGARMMGGTK